MKTTEKICFAVLFSLLLLVAGCVEGNRNHVEIVSSTVIADFEFGKLPQPIVSFGGAVHGEHFYLVGGHIGKAHDHSTENLSPLFARMELQGEKRWEMLPGSFPLQSVALVSDGKRLYRVGGMHAKNAPEEEEDMSSVLEVACYDVGKNVDGQI